MSTYLQLSTYLRQETSDVGTGPTAVTSQTGELARIVNWIDRAYTELQQEKDWRWLRKSFTVNTVASDGEYAYTDVTDTVSLIAPTRFAFWYKNTFKCYLSSAGVGGEYGLLWIPWEQFRRIYRYGTQTDGPPCHVSEDPTQKFVLGPEPDAVYVVSGDYHLGPQLLTANGDIPEMPTRFHMLIVYEAMQKYGGHRAAPEAMLRASTEGGRLYSALCRDQLPQITVGGPIA